MSFQRSRVYAKEGETYACLLFLFFCNVGNSHNQNSDTMQPQLNACIFTCTQRQALTKLHNAYKVLVYLLAVVQQRCPIYGQHTKISNNIFYPLNSKNTFCFHDKIIYTFHRIIINLKIFRRSPYTQSQRCDIKILNAKLSYILMYSVYYYTNVKTSDRA